MVVRSLIGQCYCCYCTYVVVVWLSGNAFVSINEVVLCCCGEETVSVQNQPPRSTQPAHPAVGRHNEYQRKLGSKQPHDTLAGVCGLAVLAGVWLRTS